MRQLIKEEIPEDLTFADMVYILEKQEIKNTKHKFKSNLLRKRVQEVGEKWLREL